MVRSKMSVSKAAESYIEGHPSVRDCVKKRLINYSRLSREILRQAGLGKEDFDAVLIACRRYSRKLAKAAVAEDEIIGLLARSRLDVKTKVAVVVLEKVYSEELIALEKKARRRRDIFYAIEGTEAMTIVVAMDMLSEMKAAFKGSIIKVWENIALVAIRSQVGKQDATPGFIAFITSKLSQQGINILEIMSCWSETLLVVSESDIARVLEALKFQ